MTWLALGLAVPFVAGTLTGVYNAVEARILGWRERVATDRAVDIRMAIPLPVERVRLTEPWPVPLSPRLFDRLLTPAPAPYTSPSDLPRHASDRKRWPPDSNVAAPGRDPLSTPLHTCQPPAWYVPVLDRPVEDYRPKHALLEVTAEPIEMTSTRSYDASGDSTEHSIEAIGGGVQGASFR